MAYCVSTEPQEDIFPILQSITREIEPLHHHPPLLQVHVALVMVRSTGPPGTGDQRLLCVGPWPKGKGPPESLPTWWEGTRRSDFT